MNSPEYSAGARGSTFALLLGVLALACALRFFMLSEIGIRGSDNVYHLGIARGWIDAPIGKRGIIVDIYEIAAKVGGDSDWSIKSLNASLDVFSVILTFLITLRISRRRSVALIATLSYAVLPRAIAFSRTELLHTAATSFLLTSVACLIWYLTTSEKIRRLVYLCLSGLFIGLGFGVHEDLLPFIPGMLACVLLAAHGRSESPGRPFRLRMGTALGHTGLFLATALSVMTPLGVGSRLIRFANRLERELQASLGAGGARKPFLISNPEFDFFEFARNMVEFNSSTLLAFLFFALLIAVVALTLTAHILPALRAYGEAMEPSRPIGLVGLSPAILVVSYLGLYPFSNWYIDSRHFLAALPLVLTSVFVWLDWVMGFLLRPGLHRDIPYALVALAVVLLNSWENPTRSEMSARVDPERRSFYYFSYPPTVPIDPKDSFDSSKYPISPYRVVYDLLRDRVDERNRLLVTPYITQSSKGKRRTFKHYFGDDAVYIEDCEGSLEEFIDDRRIRYIIFAGVDPRQLTREPLCYGLRKDQYTLEKEWELLGSFLVENAYQSIRAPSNNDDFFLFEASGKRP